MEGGRPGGGEEPNRGRKHGVTLEKGRKGRKETKRRRNERGKGRGTKEEKKRQESKGETAVNLTINILGFWAQERSTMYSEILKIEGGRSRGGS